MTDIVERLRMRAKIRMESPDRLSRKEGKPDRAALLMEEAAEEITLLRQKISKICPCTPP